MRQLKKHRTQKHSNYKETLYSQHPNPTIACSINKRLNLECSVNFRSFEPSDYNVYSKNTLNSPKNQTFKQHQLNTSKKNYLEDYF